MSIRWTVLLVLIGALAVWPAAGMAEELGNGGFENDWGDHTQLGEDITFPVTVDSSVTSDWETLVVGDWIRGALGNWCEPPAGTGNSSNYAGALRKPSGHFQATSYGSVASGATITLNWDYHVPTGLTVGPTFAFRIFGVNEAGVGETETQFNDVSTTLDASTTVTGESGNFDEIAGVELTISASDPDNGTWQSASASQFTVNDSWDYIVVLFGRNAGDGNNAYVQVDNISLTATDPNVAPTADAGADQTVNDADDSGAESITLDGTGSSDSDGTIASYVWEENSSQIATGSSPTVSIAVGVHTIDLTVTDDDDDTDTDSVTITVTEYVNLAPTADAGADQTVTDTDDSGSESVTLDGSGSTDSDGTISSYAWTENSTQIATGSGPSVSLAVGSHTITLTVTDDDSATDTDTVVITVDAAPSSSPAVLNFSTSGDDLTITAERSDQSEQFWQLVIDETRGVITEFYDLTSTAGTNFNFASTYGTGAGLFVPYDSEMRRGYYTYTAGTKTNGASSYSYTLYYDNGIAENTTTVTINAPDEDGTVFTGQTSAYYEYAATVAQKGGPQIWLHASSETEMNSIYTSTDQDDLSIDGTLWLEVEVADTTQAATLNLPIGRTFLLTALDYTDGSIGLEGAWGIEWDDSFQVRGGVSGGIYDNYASKPPADTTCVTNAKLEIDIVALTAVNVAPTADAGTDQTVTDSDNSGSESVTLDGSGSSDSDGTISSYVWTENSSQIATGSGPSVSLAVGTHTITLTVTDDDSATDTDTVVVTVEEGYSPAVELLTNGDFETAYAASTLGVDVTFPVTVDDDPAGDWESICVGEWVRGAAGNWQDAPDGTGNDSDLAAVVRKTAGTMQVATKGAVSSGDTLKLNWDYHVPTGLTTGPTFGFRVFGMNEAGTGETDTTVNGVSGVADSPTTVSGETANYEELGNVTVTVSASDPDNGTWQSATETTITVDDDWDYIVLMFSRTAGDNNIAGYEIDNISLMIPAQGTPPNAAPTADAGSDQNVTDSDENGSESVTLDGSGSSDSDGTITSYVWKENSTQIATGSGPSVTLNVGSHTIELTVTDDESATDTDTVVVTVSAPSNQAPVADAGTNQAVTDTDDNGSESVTLDGTGSTDSDGTISSYVWKENSTQIATGSGPSVTLNVGSHTIELTVTDDDSATDTDTVVVNVYGPSTGNMLYPGSSWDGTAGSGYATTPTESSTQIGTGTAKAIAHFDVVPKQIIDDDFAIGVVAFHHEGINKVEFLCEGNTVDVTSMTLNSRTGVTEYTAVLDISEFDNGTNGDGRMTIYARVIPNSGYERLLELDLFANPDGTLFGGDVGKIVYVCGTNGDDTRTLAEAQNSATPLKTLKRAVDLGRGLATYGSYGGNGIIIEILSAGAYPFNRPLSNYIESWITVRPTSGLDRDDVSIVALGTETEWPSLNLKTSIKFENITFDVSYWTSMSGHWADGCLYTDPRGAWHAGGGATWTASTRTLTRQYFFAGYDHTARAAAGQNYVWIRSGDAGVTPGVYEIESKTSDDAIVLKNSICSTDASVTFGRGHDFLRTNSTAYATGCDFTDVGSGPGKFKIVRDCLGDTNTGDFMQEWNLVVNTEIRNFHGAWSGYSGTDFHSDVFQRVAATDNSILYGVKAYDIDEATQMLFFENSTSTMGGNGQHDNWALVNCLFERDADSVYDLPLTQFTRTCDHVVVTNNTFIGQSVTFRVAGEETFVPSDALISQNVFDLLSFTDSYLTGAEIDDNHYVNGSAPTGDSNATTGSSLTSLFYDPANDDYTPISTTLTDRATPLVPIDIEGVTRSNPTAIGAYEE